MVEPKKEEEEKKDKIFVRPRFVKVCSVVVYKFFSLKCWKSGGVEHHEKITGCGSAREQLGRGCGHEEVLQPHSSTAHQRRHLHGETRFWEDGYLGHSKALGETAFRNMTPNKVTYPRRMASLPATSCTTSCPTRRWSWRVTSSRWRSRWWPRGRCSRARSRRRSPGCASWRRGCCCPAPWWTACWPTWSGATGGHQLLWLIASLQNIR